MNSSKIAWLQSIFIVLLILAGNFILYWNTQSKMISYSTNPPFRLDDFTKSYRKSSNSNLNHLLEDSDKTWIKLQEGRQDSDIDLELGLTHVWNGKNFSLKKWNKLRIEACSKSTGRISIILREAINVDKELRLPDDKVVFSEDFSFNPPTDYSLSPENYFELAESNSYPNGIFILVLRLKFQPSETPSCLRRVYFQ